MSEDELNLVRAIERNHVRVIAAESKAREEAHAAHIAILQDQLRDAENCSASLKSIVNLCSVTSSSAFEGLSYKTPHLEAHKIETCCSETLFEHGSPSLGQIESQEWRHPNTHDDDPLEVLGRLVESTLGRQVNLP
jgi:hypothetical protein